MSSIIDLDAPVPMASAVRTRRLSILRIALLVLLLGSIGGGMWLYANRHEVLPLAEPAPAVGWAAPYVDATITPFFAFEDPGDPVNDIVLSFVVAEHGRPCSPAWGGIFDLELAARDLDLDRRLVRLRQTGKDAVVSFGGAINDELALACDDLEQLTAAYLDVVDRYDVATVDFDIEGAALDDDAAHERRGVAVAAVQQRRQEQGRDLAVWLTVPVTPSGLPDGALAAVDAMLGAGVEVAGVNIMTMNFNADADAAMFDLVTGAAESSAVQLHGLWVSHGVEMHRAEAWQRLGVTPMIGRNDVTHEVFSLSDAARLAQFATERGIARISYWSLNRDRPCPPNEVDVVAASNICAHVDQDVLAFAEAFSTLTGRHGSGSLRQVAIELVEDDPERSPYPIWRPDQAYQAGEKVVWHGYVYEAKWYALAEDPEAPVEQVWDTPWRVVGPVLEQDLLEPVRIDRGFAPDWSPETTYTAGDRVWVDGSVYEAKWWTEGEPPGRPSTDRHESPWELLDPRDLVDGTLVGQ